jgi:hypothetical protein
MQELVIFAIILIWEYAKAGCDRRVGLFDAKKKQPLVILDHHHGCDRTIAYAPNELLASEGEDRGLPYDHCTCQTIRFN